MQGQLFGASGMEETGAAERAPRNLGTAAQKTGAAEWRPARRRVGERSRSARADTQCSAPRADVSRRARAASPIAKTGRSVPRSAGSGTSHLHGQPGPFCERIVDWRTSSIALCGDAGSSSSRPSVAGHTARMLHDV